MKIYKESIFWIASLIVLVLFFGQQFKDYEAAFYFTCFFLPIIIGVSYIFSLILVPQYLLVKQFFRFGLYTLYTMVISLNLITIIMVLSFALLANYRHDEHLPGSRDVFGLVIIMFFIALIKAFWGLIKIKSDQDRIVNSLIAKDKLNKEEFLIVISNRQKMQIAFNNILYIESLSDYVKIIQQNSEPIITKEKISHLDGRTPDSFLRIHRSFIINSVRISGFNSETATINNNEIPIGRKYKPAFKQFIDSRNNENS